jgi:hypothetical protein
MIDRKLAALALALSAGSCTQQDAQFQGTIAGEPFVPADAAGFVMEPRPCAEFGGFSGATPNATIVEVRFGDFGGLCELTADAAFCGAKENTRMARIAVATANVYGGPVPPIEPGTYTDAGTHVVDANGVVRYLWMGLDARGASCAPLTAGMPKEAAGGSITLDEVGPARLRGRAELRFDNGDVLSGAFDVPICAAPDAAQCAVTEGCAAIACVP